MKEHQLTNVIGILDFYFVKPSIVKDMTSFLSSDAANSSMITRLSNAGQERITMFLNHVANPFEWPWHCLIWMSCGSSCTLS